MFVFVMIILVAGGSIAANEECANYSEVLSQTKLNAEYGDTSSMFILGKIYQEAKCVIRDFEIAHKWLTKAAAKGHVEAKFHLGLLYYIKGPDHDNVKALNWFKQAYDSGDGNASYYLGEIYLFGKGVAKNHRLALIWLKLASSKNNDPRAHYLIGYFYQKGIKRRRNYRKAFSWYVKAALLGYNEAHYRIASFYDRGIGVRRNSIKAYTWYSIAEKHGYTRQAKRKNRLFKSMSAEKIAKADKMIRRYMQTMDYPEYQ